MRLPTVKVKAENDAGFAVINADDFDPSLHTAFEAGDGYAPTAPRLESRKTRKSK